MKKFDQRNHKSLNKRWFNNFVVLNITMLQITSLIESSRRANTQNSVIFYYFLCFEEGVLGTQVLGVMWEDFWWAEVGGYISVLS